LVTIAMNSFFHEIRQGVAALLSSTRCMSCRMVLAQEAVFCDACLCLVQPVASLRCAITPTNVMRVFALSAYKEPVRSLIMAKHYDNRVAGKQLALLLWRYSAISHIPFDYLVPIPLHWLRYASRGYNQAEVMAQELSRLSGKPVVSLLKRVRKSSFQAGLSAPDRKRNVKSIFALDNRLSPEHYHGKRFMLVDDLMTTGATLQEGARALLPLSVSIDAVVACRTV